MAVSRTALAGLAAVAGLAVQTPAQAASVWNYLEFFFVNRTPSGDGFDYAYPPSDKPYALATSASAGGQAGAFDHPDPPGPSPALLIELGTSASTASDIDDSQYGLGQILARNPGQDIRLASLTATAADTLQFGYFYNAQVDGPLGRARSDFRIALWGRSSNPDDPDAFYLESTRSDFANGGVIEQLWNTSPLFTVAAGTTYDIYLREFRLQSHAGAVPEPQTWLLLIAGFALVGAVLRRAPSAPEQREATRHPAA